MSKPKPRRKLPRSNFKPAPNVPRDRLAKPGEPGYWFKGEQYVGIRVTCRTCGDNRRMGLLALSTFPEDDGEIWFTGQGVEPARFNTSIVLRCRGGHNVPLRLDKITSLLRRMKDETGPSGRRVVSKAL
jgi:hypothetical protein